MITLLYILAAYAAFVVAFLLIAQIVFGFEKSDNLETPKSKK